jgi:hypothetical protein
MGIVAMIIAVSFNMAFFFTVFGPWIDRVNKVRSILKCRVA